MSKSGTQIGLVLGFDSLNYPIEVLGINVFQNKEIQMETLNSALSQTVLKRIKLIVSEDYYGNGYAQPTAEMKEAIELLAQTEGIFLDPIYSGRTMAGLIDLIKNGYFIKNSKILFLHTGGLPTFYDYSSMN